MQLVLLKKMVRTDRQTDIRTDRPFSENIISDYRKANVEKKYLTLLEFPCNCDFRLSWWLAHTAWSPHEQTRYFITLASNLHFFVMKPHTEAKYSKGIFNPCVPTFFWVSLIQPSNGLYWKLKFCQSYSYFPSVCYF